MAGPAALLPSLTAVTVAGMHHRSTSVGAPRTGASQGFDLYCPSTITELLLSRCCRAAWSEQKSSGRDRIQAMNASAKYVLTFFFVVGGRRFSLSSSFSHPGDLSLSPSPLSPLQLRAALSLLRAASSRRTEPPPPSSSPASPTKAPSSGSARATPTTTASS